MGIEPFVNIKTLSKEINVPVRTIRTLVKERKIPHFRPGYRTLLFRVSDVLAALDKFEVREVGRKK